MMSAFDPIQPVNLKGQIGMRRTTFVLGLAAVSAAIALAALIYGVLSPQHSPDAAKKPAEADHAPNTLPLGAADRQSKPTEIPEQFSGVDQETAGTERPPDRNAPPRRLADEEETAKWVREDAMREAPKRHSLIIERLALTPSEKEALLEVLIEDWIASTKTRYSSGEGMDEQERLDRIAAIIGDTKLRQFLAMERNLGQHIEVLYMQDVLQQSEVPMTTAQRDRMLEILIEIQNQDLSVPGADAERGSIERLEYRLAEINERERLIFEQAASVLSAEQVGYLFEWYQRDSYRRADALERQREARADDSADDLPLYYPARTDPDTLQ